MLSSVSFGSGGMLMGGQRDPRRHGGSDETAFDGGVEIVVGGQRARGSRAALEDGSDEVARLGIDPLRVFAVAVATGAMAAPTVAVIEFRTRVSMTGEAVHMGFLIGIRLRQVRLLGVDGHRKRERERKVQTSFCE